MHVNRKHTQNMIFYNKIPNESLCHDKHPLSIKSVNNENKLPQVVTNNIVAKIIIGISDAE